MNTYYRGNDLGKTEEGNRRKGSVSAARRIRAAVLLAASLLLCLAVTGCAEIRITKPLDRNTLLEINDTTCSVGTGVLRLLEAKEEYDESSQTNVWDLLVDGITMEEYVKDAVRDDLEKYTAAQAMAENLTVFITEEEQEKIRTDAEELLTHIKEIYDLGHFSVTIDDAVDLFMKRTYYNKVYEKLSENILMEISEVETKAIEIDYVLIPTADGVEAAEKVRNEIKAGYDFTAVCDSYGYKAEVNVAVTKGTFPAAFENIAFALRDNEVSEIVETKDGFYIIYCLEDYMVADSLANRNRVISDGKKERFDRAYQEFAAVSKMRFNTGEWKKLDLSAMGE